MFSQGIDMEGINNVVDNSETNKVKVKDLKDFLFEYEYMEHQVFDNLLETSRDVACRNLAIDIKNFIDGNVDNGC